jgi:hypothetical protein
MAMPDRRSALMLYTTRSLFPLLATAALAPAWFLLLNALRVGIQASMSDLGGTPWMLTAASKEFAPQ